MTECWKQPYRSRTRAERARDAWRRDDPSLMPYKCSVCGWWHNGHSSRAPQLTDQPVPKKRAPQRCWYCDAVIVFAPWPGDPKPMPCEPETLEPHHHRRAVLRQGRVA